MKTLISPTEVLSLAFGTTHTLEEGAVPHHSILAAEQSFLLPALGEKLYTMLATENPDEECAGFVEEYLKQPLALYVASRLLPTLAVKIGSAGVARLTGESFEAVDEQTLHKVVVRLRRDADTLLARALDYLADNPTLFPDYEPQTPKHRIIGGIVM